MPGWLDPGPRETVVAHISDLHFGSKNGARDSGPWPVLRDFLTKKVQPHLLLFTGDIVDTPNERLYKEAYNEIERLAQDLKAPYYVCPGNHDRHLKGNVVRRFIPRRLRANTSALFDQEFGAQVLPHTKLTVAKAGPHGLTFGLLGIDSSRNADYFARGYIEPRILQQVRSAVGSLASDVDLVIVLVHHHLLAVRRLEEGNRGQLQNLANATSLVNSGSFLETLAKSHVDLVLHGHEHLSKGAQKACSNQISAGSRTTS